MNILKKYQWQISTAILFLLLILLPRNCGKIETRVEYIKVPSKEGSFSSYKPTSINLPNYIFFNGKDTVELENPINKELESKYLQAEKDKDSLKLKLLYYEAIQMRKYHEVYEDKNIVIDVFANTTGTLDSLGVKYKTKEDSIRLKTSRFKLYTGGGIYAGPNTNPGFKVNLGLQNKKDNLLMFSYDPLNKTGFIDYNIKIIDIKK